MVPFAYNSESVGFNEFHLVRQGQRPKYRERATLEGCLLLFVSSSRFVVISPAKRTMDVTRLTASPSQTYTGSVRPAVAVIQVAPWSALQRASVANGKIMV
jgi:hypothetical protein